MSNLNNKNTIILGFLNNRNIKDFRIRTLTKQNVGTGIFAKKTNPGEYWVPVPWAFLLQENWFWSGSSLHPDTNILKNEKREKFFEEF